MSRKVFVSYEFIEKEVARTLQSWFQAGGGTCQGQLVFVFDPDARTDPAIDRAILKEMCTCDIALFLTSENVHNKQWIDREAQVAESRNMPIVAIRLQGSPAGLPNRLKSRKNVHLVQDWSANALCPVLNAIPISRST
jgi:hypothetical protein